MEAFIGLDIWQHTVDHTHWFILDLDSNYTITKVKGMCKDGPIDPIDVNIYVSTSNGSWSTPVASNISTWQDNFPPYNWIEVDTIDKYGRYIKVEIVHTEDDSQGIAWQSPPIIFSVLLDFYSGSYLLGSYHGTSEGVQYSTPGFEFVFVFVAFGLLLLFRRNKNV